VKDYLADGSVKSDIIKVADRVSKTASTARAMTLASYYAAGDITYKRLYQTDPQERAQVQYEMYYSDNEAYTINGQAADTLAVIVGIVASIISVFIPAAAVWKQIAIAVVSAWGGSIAGGAIGVFFSEDVAVNAYYYHMRGYDYNYPRYSQVYSGIARKVTTQSSGAYNEWFYDGFTPYNWRDNTLAYWIWTDLWPTQYPGVEYYS